MCHVNFVIIILEGALEGESVVGTSSFTLHCVLIVANVFTCTVPANATGFGRVFDGVKQGLLALIVGAVRLYQINYVEFVPDILAYVAHFEVVPLGVSCCAKVILQDQVVGVFSDA